MSAIVVHDLSGAVLKAVIIYDDFDSATRATALLERVALGTDEAVKWDIKPWKLDVLKQPALAALTVAVAAHADLVVLALGRMHSASAELLNWLRDWAAHRRIEDAALLALPVGDTEMPSNSWNALKTFAEEQSLIFLSQPDAGKDENSAPLGHRWQRQLAALGPERVFAGKLPPPLHWGINE